MVWGQPFQGVKVTNQSQTLITGTLFAGSMFPINLLPRLLQELESESQLNWRRCKVTEPPEQPNQGLCSALCETRRKASNKSVIAKISRSFSYSMSIYFQPFDWNLLKLKLVAEPTTHRLFSLYKDDSLSRKSGSQLRGIHLLVGRSKRLQISSCDGCFPILPSCSHLPLFLMAVDGLRPLVVVETVDHKLGGSWCWKGWVLVAGLVEMQEKIVEMPEVLGSFRLWQQERGGRFVSKTESWRDETLWTWLLW